MAENSLKDKSILIPGGTGSFGKGFVKYLLANTEAKKIIIFSRDEFKQTQIDEELKNPRLRFFLGDIRDSQRLQRAFYNVDVIIHAAALKQVPSVEYNPFEAIKTNIIGSQNVIDAAIDQGVKKVILISTDKAALPANLYGSTKLCAEKLFISGGSYGGGRTKLSCVRYGNVIGSRGSIVEALLKHKDVKKVCLTDDRMTRFWISLEQSFNLVMFALEKMKGGEIFIPKLPSMKLTDLFDCLAPKAEREIIGLRPGEKINEVLLTLDEARHSVEFENYFIILPEFKNDPVLEERYAEYIKFGKKIPENFIYTSDNNDSWLNKEDFKKITDSLQ